jgi:glycosyltransferase involved in cell wall biosynthesis
MDINCIYNPKVLIVTRHFPPILNGPSIVLSKLVSHWPKVFFSIFTRDYHKSYESIDYDYELDIPTVRFRWNNSETRINRINDFAKIRRLVKGICVEAILRKSQIILGITDDGPFFISAYLAAKKLDIPLVIYMLDLYEEGRRSRIQKFFAKRYEPRIFAYASAVLVMSERMQDHYQQKYGVGSTVVPHPIDTGTIINTVSVIKQKEIKNRPLQVVFTGHITAAQYGSIMDLVRIVGDNPSEFSLKLCVPMKEALKGILPSNVEMISLGRKDVLKAQRDADILFLPYSFDNPYPDIIRTASPSKLPEYLAAGRPILYYGPEYSYVKWYFDKTKAALCVTRPERNDLLKALRYLRDGDGIRNEIARNAVEAAKVHKSETVANSVWQTFIKVFDANGQFGRF